MDCCSRVADTVGRCLLRSASQHYLTVPRYWLSRCGCRAFSVVVLATWNSLPDSLRDPALSSDSFRCLLKTQLFKVYATRSRSFKVTDFGTNRKPICNFLLVINTNLPCILHRFRVIADYWLNFRLRQGSASL